MSNFSELQSLSPNSLSSQGNTLSHLVLTKNLLTDVPTKAINKLRELDHINLNDNQITHLKNGAFTGLSKVSPCPQNVHNKYELRSAYIQVFILTGHEAVNLQQSNQTH